MQKLGKEREFCGRYDPLNLRLPSAGTKGYIGNLSKLCQGRFSQPTKPMEAVSSATRLPKRHRPASVPATERAPTMDPFWGAAIAEAKQGLAEGGIPIGSVLVIDGRIVGRGHNRRVQKGSAIFHAEMDCLENAGRLKGSDYRRAVLYSTLSPCDMCSGTALLYQIPKIVIGENQTFRGPEAYLRSRGVELVVINDPECVALMREFIRANPELWNEDIGV